MSVAPPAVDAMPGGFDEVALRAAGFEGWRSWEQLRASNFSEIPRVGGCYVVYRPTSRPPQLLATSPAGHYKGSDPTVSLARLQAAWVPDSQVLYIGKATVLRTRLRQYGQFGAGQPVAHRGGRLIWQLADSQQLQVAWRPSQRSPRDVERELIAHFAAGHGRRPLANLVD